MKHRALALFLAVAATAGAAEREFDVLVKAVEHHYGVKRTSIPFLGVANFFVKVAHPAGASGFKLALFEDLPLTVRDPAELDRFVRDSCGRDLHPVVATHSQANGESTYILTGEIGKSTRMLVANFDRHQATVVELTVDMDALLRFINSPGMARHLGLDSHHDGSDW